LPTNAKKTLNFYPEADSYSTCHITQQVNINKRAYVRYPI